ncbi:MAG: O-antigen ligase family protein [Clostridia bacterium]|nr:O-antigen ligase family protein [Clostridia bacterium]
MMGKIERVIILLYIVFLPVTNITFLKDKIYTAGNSLSFYVHILGMVLMVFSCIKAKRLNLDYRIKMSVYILTILNISSLLMAVVLHENLGVLIGRDTYKAVFPYLIYYSQYILIIIYNSYIFNEVGMKKIVRWIMFSFILLLIYGYIQLLLMRVNIGILNLAMSFLENVDIPYVLDRGKINLTSTEASKAGCLLSVYVFPLLFSIYKNNVYKKSFIVLLIALYLPILFFTQSTSGYIGFVIAVLCYYMLDLKRSMEKRRVHIHLTIAALVAVIALWIVIDNFEAIEQSTIYQTTFVKLSDSENLSTMQRSTSIYTNMKAVLDYPILGVGNGNQGFFYIKYFPDWGFQSFEAAELYYDRTKWPGAGAFIPSYVSGYGALGVILLLILIRNAWTSIRRLRGSKLNFISDFVIISSAVFIFQAISTTDVIGMYYLVFIYSLAIDTYSTSIK